MGERHRPFLLVGIEQGVRGSPSASAHDSPQRFDIFDRASSIHKHSHDQTAEQILHATRGKRPGGGGGGGETFGVFA